MYKNEEKIIDIQIIATILFIVSLTISLVLTYNDKYKTKYGKGFFNNETNYKISVLNRILVVILSFVFLYVNYSNKEIAKNKGQKTKPFQLQIMASELSILAALIVTYVVINSGEYSLVTSIENPGL